MINLLPENTKKQLRAARTNTILVRYVITIIIAAVFLGLAIITSYYIMADSKKNVETLSQTSLNSNQTGTKSNPTIVITNAKNILANEISYSTILTNIINSLPSGVILEAPLSINKNNVSTPIILKAKAKSSDVETLLKTNFQNNPIFLNYSLQSNTQNPTDANYPIIITFSLTLNKGLI